MTRHPAANHPITLVTIKQTLASFEAKLHTVHGPVSLVKAFPIVGDALTLLGIVLLLVVLVGVVRSLLRCRLFAAVLQGCAGTIAAAIVMSPVMLQGVIQLAGRTAAAL
jgi:hypothetical protein